MNKPAGGDGTSQSTLPQLRLLQLRRARIAAWMAYASKVEVDAVEEALHGRLEHFATIRKVGDSYESFPRHRGPQGAQDVEP